MNPQPLTITAAVWNYCNNNCFYCVSESNRPEWSYKGRFEVFTPPGCEGMTDQQMRARFGPNYYENLCTDKTLLNAKDVMRFDFLAYWIQNHAPAAEIHLSGGEPLMRPDIESGVQLLVDRGLSVSILTNGAFLPKRPRLLDMPIRWHITHHAAQPLDKFLKAIEPIKTRPHLLTRLWLADAAKNRARLEKAYSGFNFMWKGCNRPKTEHAPPGAPGADRVASSVIHLITPDGRVFPCNSLAWPHIGHIYLDTYEPEKAAPADLYARRCIGANNCGAYVTAWQMYNLKESDFLHGRQ